MAMRVGLIGYGAIGRDVHARIVDEPGSPIEIVGVLVREPGRDGRASAGRPVPFVGSVDELLALGPSLVVEAAGHDAFATHVPAILAAGVDVLAISVGALADEAVAEAVRAAATAGHARLRVPSGAIAALDAISAAAVGPIDRVSHTVRKPPASLLPEAEAAEVVRGGVPRELFAGPAREAALRYPANVNVVAAVSLAGIGLDRTEARVVADPSVTRNTHEVVAEGWFGRLSLTMENIPTENPKTGRIVALSLVRALRAHGESIVVGG
jgi:aspartate dehydrogenase